MSKIVNISRRGENNVYKWRMDIKRGFRSN